ncbi:MAG: hypothetical protein R6U50_09095 [Desulfobacterales bacterium]
MNTIEVKKQQKTGCQAENGRAWEPFRGGKLATRGHTAIQGFVVTWLWLNSLIVLFGMMPNPAEAFYTPDKLSILPIVQNREEPDIQWFKDRLQISEKYVEQEEGIFGISWFHFFVMVLLVAIGVGALVLNLLKQKRMREIVTSIRKEMETHEG